MIAQDLIISAARSLRDSSLVFFTQGVMYEFLKEAIEEIANRSKTLFSQEFRAVSADKTDYDLPEKFISIIRVEHLQGANWMRLSPSDQVGERRFNPSSNVPVFYTPGPRSRRLRASGTATGGSATQLIDTSGIEFTALDDPPVAGDLMLNLTDGSEGIVNGAMVTETTVDSIKALLGGVDNTWSADDKYEIQSFNTPLHSVRIWPPPKDADTGGEESLSIHFLSAHYDLDAEMTARGLDVTDDPCNLELDLDREFEPAIRERLKAKMLEFRKGISHPDAIRQEGKAEQEFRRSLPTVRSRIEEDISTWYRGRSMFQSLNITRDGVAFSEN